MSQTQVRASRPAAGAVRPGLEAASLALLGLVLFVVLFTALRSPLKDDIAWLLYVARRWLAGRELYVDLVEVNPPLIIWLSAIPIRIAGWLGADPQPVAIIFFISIVLACARWTATLLRPAGGLFVHRLPVFAVIGIVLLLVPGADLGQREHLLVAAVLPYLVLFARALDGNPTPRATAIAAGVLAGLGCALKPRYGAVFAVLECVAMLHGLRPWRAKPLAAIAALVCYVGLVRLICPTYLSHAVPMALALYGATNVPFTHLLADSASLLMCMAVAALLYLTNRCRMPEHPLMLTLVAFAATSSVICFVDGKDWFYHRLPATIVTFLALILWTASVVRRDPACNWRRPLASMALAGLALAVLSVADLCRLGPDLALAMQPRGSAVVRLENLIRAQHARSYIAFSEWIALGFPVVNNTGVAWTSRFDSMWALKGELWRARFDPTAAKEWPVERWVVHDFIAGCPDIAVVDARDKRDPDWIGLLSAMQPVFARTWSQYRLIAAFDGLAVYRRNAAGCINPWVASAGGPAADTGRNGGAATPQRGG